VLVDSIDWFTSATKNAYQNKFGILHSRSHILHPVNRQVAYIIFDSSVFLIRPWQEGTHPCSRIMEGWDQEKNLNVVVRMLEDGIVSSLESFKLLSSIKPLPVAAWRRTKSNRGSETGSRRIFETWRYFSYSLKAIFWPVIAPFYNARAWQ
jgi:hypothetical protein